MAIDFPASPTNGQTFTVGSVTYTWDGTKWTAVASGGGGGVTDGDKGDITVSSGGTVWTVDNGLAVTKLADGTARQLLQTDAAGTAVEWTSNVDIPGTLDVTGATTLDGNLTVDTDTLFVDATNNRVGIGTTSAAGNSGTRLVLHDSASPRLRLTNNTTGQASSDGSEILLDTSNLIIENRESASTIFYNGGSERMRITSNGTLLHAKTSDNLAIPGVQFFSNGAIYNTRDNGIPFLINRLSSDGGLVDFYQDTVAEGNISVSGSTVSLVGAHLARWSQLPGGAERTEILRGTVLSNIDEMCAWGDEDNEQLNRMKVSDVEGDPNVAGVFQSWDDDDDTYTDDFHCAMTGDFIIRIAGGVPVHKGQLLMSAGDGTAKPQEDDIIRSKTIAKVTSNHVTCTYDDGSYCVPCVLMAC